MGVVDNYGKVLTLVNYFHAAWNDAEFAQPFGDRITILTKRKSGSNGTSSVNHIDRAENAEMIGVSIDLKVDAFVSGLNIDGFIVTI